jgi:hypothetical protein
VADGAPTLPDKAAFAFASPAAGFPARATAAQDQVEADLAWLGPEVGRSRAPGTIPAFLHDHVHGSSVRRDRPRPGGVDGAHDRDRRHPGGVDGARDRGRGHTQS